jgi:hypothetical protein
MGVAPTIIYFSISVSLIVVLDIMVPRLEVPS